MDFSIEWTPDQGTNGIATFDEYQEVVKDDETPNFGTGWSKKEMRSLIVNSPGCENVMWKSVLAIWRLRGMEGRLKGEGSLAKPWAEHLGAWLTRHRDLCRAFHVQPFQIIVEYAADAVKEKRISPHLVPEFANTERTPAPPARAVSQTPAPQEDVPMRAIVPPSPAPQKVFPMRSNLSQTPAPQEDIPTRAFVTPSPAPQEVFPPRASLSQTPAPQEHVPMRAIVPPSPAPQEVIPMRSSLSQTPAPQEDVPMRLSISPTPSPREDVPMNEEEVVVVPRTADKGKSRAPAIPDVNKSTRPKPAPKKIPATDPAVGTKRELSNSPSKEDGPSTSKKKRRGGKERSVLLGGVDLEGMIVKEGEQVDATLVPLVEGRVCDTCDPREDWSDRCIPRWYHGQERINIQCHKCHSRKQGCSFRPEHFGIGKWPILIRKDANAPQTESESVVDVPSVATRASGPNTRSKKRAQATRNTLRDTAPSTAFVSTRQAMGTPQTTPAVGMLHSPSPIGPAAGDPNAADRTTLYYADLTPFGVAAQDPDQSLLDLQLYRTQLRTIMRREWNDVSEALATGSERRQIGAQLLVSLNVAIVERGGRPLFPRSEFEPTVAGMTDLNTDALLDLLLARNAAQAGMPDFEGSQ